MNTTRISLATLIALVLVGCASNKESDPPSLKEGAREVGHAAGTAAREVGQGAKKVGKTVAEAAKETGHAFRDAVKGDSP